MKFVFLEDEKDPGDVEVICLDATFFNTPERINAWKAKYPSEARIILLLKDDDRCPKNMSTVTRLINGVAHLFEGETVEQAIHSLLMYWSGAPDDMLDPKETVGAVSMEEFEETLLQASLPSSDPNKRD